MSLPLTFQVWRCCPDAYPAGCGKSEGEFISLGYYERDDLQVVTDYLRDTGRVSTIGLWGRSMGAATALLHADRDPSIGGIVADSAFGDLHQLAQEIVEHGRQEGYTIPHFLVKIALRMIRSSVLKRAKFDIDDLRPIDHAPSSFSPALFVGMSCLLQLHDLAQLRKVTCLFSLTTAAKSTPRYGCLVLLDSLSSMPETRISSPFVAITIRCVLSFSLTRHASSSRKCCR